MPDRNGKKRLIALQISAWLPSLALVLPRLWHILLQLMFVTDVISSMVLYQRFRDTADHPPSVG